MEVYLTPLQKQVYDLYVHEGLNQKQVAQKIYNDELKQGRISKCLKLVSKKLGVDLVEQYPKRKSLIKCNIILPDD
jgi:aspartate/glutamate racemase